MATLNAPKSISKRQELGKDTAVTFVVKAQEFFFENRTLVYGIAAGIVVVILAIVGYAYMQNQKDATAQELLGGIIVVYEGGDFRAALDGTETSLGLLSIVDDYGSTEAGNMARFYTADALFRLGEFDQALEHFEAFSGGDDIVGVSALAGAAAIYEIKEDHERAGNLYRSAALNFDNKLTSPEYLLASGRAYENAQEYGKARDAYVLIQERFPESAQAQQIDFYLARVEARLK